MQAISLLTFCYSYNHISCCSTSNSAHSAQCQTCAFHQLSTKCKSIWCLHYVFFSLHCILCSVDYITTIQSFYVWWSLGRNPVHSLKMTRSQLHTLPEAPSTRTKKFGMLRLSAYITNVHVLPWDQCVDWEGVVCLQHIYTLNAPSLSKQGFEKMMLEIAYGAYDFFSLCQVYNVVCRLLINNVSLVPFTALCLGPIVNDIPCHLAFVANQD